MLLAYGAILIRVMVFKDVPTFHTGRVVLDFSGTDGGHPANFVPFKTIGPYLLGNNGWLIAELNLVGNIIFLVPVGFLILLIFVRSGWKRLLAIAIASSLVIETTQVVLRVGIFDIDDVMLNALGVMIGYWMFVILNKWVRRKQYASIAATALLIVTATAAAIFVGYPIGDHPTPPVAGEIPSSGDLCNGTGGTGQIVTVGNHAITIKRNDGLLQTLNLTNLTTIRTPTGAASEADLKTGDRVTLVVLDRDDASTVLVCGTSASEGR